MISIERGQDIHAFRRLVKERCGQDAGKCIQCGKCSAGCPIAPDMDYQPHQLMELVRLGQRDTALAARAFWYCASCQTCTIRCPHGIDIALILNTLRKLSLAGGHAPARLPMPLFNRLFVDSIRAYGRVYELGMIGRFNIASGRPFKDAILGAAMLLRGKIGLLPHRVRDLRAIKKIFSQYK